MDEKIKIKMTATTINAVPLTSSFVTAKNAPPRTNHLAPISASFRYRTHMAIRAWVKTNRLTSPDQPFGE
jgi:hypothetical protein